MTDVLLLSLPYFDRRFHVHKEMQSGIGYKKLRTGNLNNKLKLYPICDLLYAASVLKENNIKFKLDDDQYFESKNFDDYFHRIERKTSNPKLVFIRTSIGTLVSDMEISQKLKIKWPSSQIYVYGPVFSSKDVISFIKNEKIYDGIIESEIESVIIDIIKKRKLIPGFFELKKGNYVCSNSDVKYTTMENLPPPSYELVDYKSLDFLIIQTQRGCPVGCSYCPYYLSQKNKFRAKKPQTVIKEIEYLSKKFKKKNFIIHDPILSLDKKRLIEICNLLIEKKININWECETHLNHVDTSLLSLMKKAGCSKMAMGIESANSDVLKTVNRRFKDWTKAKELIQHCKKIGIKSRGYFILGLPNDSVKGSYMSIELSKYLDLDEANFNLPIPIPNTDPYNMGVKSNLIDLQLKKNNPRLFFDSLSKHNWEYDYSLSEKISKKQLQYLFRIANHSFNIHKKKKQLDINKLKVLIYKFYIYLESFFNPILKP